MSEPKNSLEQEHPVLYLISPSSQRVSELNRLVSDFDS